MQATAIIESLLIASHDPLSIDDMLRLIRAYLQESEELLKGNASDADEPKLAPEDFYALKHLTKDDILIAIHNLNEQYTSSERSFLILERPKGWKMYTKPAFAPFVRQLFPDRKAERLSGPAMETLAIIAYRQPITKASIEAVRGVSCDGMIQKLLDRQLIRIGGRSDIPGRPLLYETTSLFFEHFGIRSINDLPNASELRKIKLPESESVPAGDPQQLTLSNI